MLSLFRGHLNVFEYADFSDLGQTLEKFSENSWKTLGRLLGKSANAFYAIKVPTKSSGSILPKVIQIFDMYFVCLYI